MTTMVRAYPYVSHMWHVEVRVTVVLCYRFIVWVNVTLCSLLTAKVVDLDPCLSKKPVEDSACHPYNTRGSMSEVQSLSSFQSESCDDNGTYKEG